MSNKRPSCQTAKYRVGDRVSWWVDREALMVDCGTIAEEPEGENLVVRVDFSSRIITVPRSNLAPRD